MSPDPLPASLETPPNRPVICVYCGSSPGNSSSHVEAARELGVALHRHGIHLVYGGGTTGLMGELARTLARLSGPNAVHGYIPAALVEYERASSGIDRGNNVDYGRYTVVPDMHTRKAMMMQRVRHGGPGSGFVALSGGLGTIEELMETATWQQLSIHDNGICILNTEGFWDGLTSWIKEMVVKSGFLDEAHWDSIGVRSGAEEVISWLKEWKPKKRLILDWVEGAHTQPNLDIST